MNGNKFQLSLLALATIMITASAVAQKAPPDRLHAFKKEAAKFNSVISLPQFELTTNEVRTTVRQTIAVGNAALDTRSEERRVGKSVDLGGRRIIKKKK